MKLDDVKKLQQKKYRDRLNSFLVEGEHLILELFKATESRPRLKQAELFYTEQYSDWMLQHNTHNLRSSLISEKAMKQISGTLSPQGIVAVAPFLTYQHNLPEQAIYLHLSPSLP